MIKNILGGIAVGVANIIPGVSGGTIIVILGLFDKLMASISNVFKVNISFKERMENVWFIIQILIGAAIGLVGFAKILELLFNNFELQTYFWFIGLILFSIPMLKREELGKNKLNIWFFIIGLAVIFIINYLNPGEGVSNITLSDLLDKKMTFVYIVELVVLGAISGATMIFPGISGSMVLLVLGWYHLFKAYVANVTSFKLPILLALCFITLGVGIGIILSAKLTNYLLSKHKVNTMSFIFGLIVSSAIVIIPTNKSLYTPVGIITAIITFALGAGIVYLFDKMKNTKKES